MTNTIENKSNRHYVEKIIEKRYKKNKELKNPLSKYFYPYLQIKKNKSPQSCKISNFLLINSDHPK